MKALINKLGSRNAARCREAEKALRHLPSEQVDELVAVARFCPRSTTVRAVFVECGGFYWLFLALFLYIDMHPPVVRKSVELSVLGFIVLMLASILNILLSPRFERNVLRALQMTDHTHLLGPLLTHVTAAQSLVPSLSLRLWVGDNQPERLLLGLKEALLRVVDAVQGEDDVVLTKSECASLHAALRWRDSRAVIALLGLLEKIGGARDLPHVQKVAAGAGFARTDAAVREAGARCAAVVEARLAANSNADTLLRASHPSVGSKTLLRTVATEPEAQEQLLRSAISGEDGIDRRGGATGQPLHPRLPRADR